MDTIYKFRTFAYLLETRNKIENVYLNFRVSYFIIKKVNQYYKYTSRIVMSSKILPLKHSKINSNLISFKSYRTYWYKHLTN